jgi:hypothetical protein
MKVTMSVTLEADDNARSVVHEVFTLERGALAPDTLGLQLDEAKELLAAVQETVVNEQVRATLAAETACPGCGRTRRHKDAREIVVRSLFSTLNLVSPRWLHRPCSAQNTRTFSPLAELLPERSAPELVYLESKLAGLVSYGLSAKLLAEVLPLGRTLDATVVRRHVQGVAQSRPASSRAARPSGGSCPAQTCLSSSASTVAMSTRANSALAKTAGSR